MSSEGLGSSPRLWGTPLLGAQFVKPFRFIPTPVGNTATYNRVSLAVAVHPHACGEHTEIIPIIVPPSGSSPRLWGTLLRLQSEVQTFRFIPTPVGNTAVVRDRGPPAPVHPHACGEHARINYKFYCRFGSSPRLWGTRGRCWISPQRSRFIPTPVGNTALAMGNLLNEAVHPHACGEHLLKAAAASRKTGSSPRLWGTLLTKSIEHQDRRFIPTPVGNTKIIVDVPDINAVHPHACGEHSKNILLFYKVF